MNKIDLKILSNWKNFTYLGLPTSKMFTYFEMLIVAEESFQEEWQINHQTRNNKGQNNYKIRKFTQRNIPGNSSGRDSWEWLTKREILQRKFLMGNFLVPKLYLHISSCNKKLHIKTLHIKILSYLVSPSLTNCINSPLSFIANRF